MLLHLSRKWSSALVLLILWLSASVPAFAKTDQVFKIGYFLAEPLVLTGETPSEPKGVVIDILREVIAPAMKVKPVWSQYPFQRLLLETENGSLDAIAFLAKNPERAAKFHYPERQLGYIDPVLLMKKSSKFTTLKSREDLAGKEVTVVKGLYIPPFLKSAKVKLNNIDSSGNPHSQMLEMVHLGRVELAYLATWAGARWEIKQLKKSSKSAISGDSDFRLMKIPESRSALYTVFSKKAPESLVKAYEKALESWSMDQYRKYLARYSED